MDVRTAACAEVVVQVVERWILARLHDRELVAGCIERVLPSGVPEVVRGAPGSDRDPPTRP